MSAPSPWSSPHLGDEGNEESPADLWRRRSGFVLAPAAFALVWWTAGGLEPRAHRLAAILAAVVVAWVTEAIPMTVTALLGVAFAVVLGVASATEAFAPFADPLIFLFVGTFMLAQAILFHGLDRRFAYAILGLRGVGASPWRVLAVYSAITASISAWISNTATTAMMFPIGLSLLAALEKVGNRPSPRFATALLLSDAFAASIGGLATPVGTPPNLIGIGFIRRELDVALPFFSWMALGLPIVAVLLAVMLWDLGRSSRGEAPPGAEDALFAAERRALGPWTAGQRNTLIAFSLTIACWVAPGIAALALGQEHALVRALTTSLPEGVVALCGAGLLFVLPIDLRRHEFTLSWQEAVKIDWWIVFLYGGGIALGTLAFKTGLAAALGASLAELLGVKSGFGLLLLSTALSTVLSETTSNTASATMMVPVVIALARSAGADPVIPALGATMGASLGFMLPVSTPCNAIVYGSGRIPLRAMIRHGIFLDVAGVAVIVAVLSLFGPWLVGR